MTEAKRDMLSDHELIWLRIRLPLARSITMSSPRKHDGRLVNVFEFLRSRTRTAIFTAPASLPNMPCTAGKSDACDRFSPKFENVTCVHLAMRCHGRPGRPHRHTATNETCRWWFSETNCAPSNYNHCVLKFSDVRKQIPSTRCRFVRNLKKVVTVLRNNLTKKIASSLECY